MLNNVKNWVTQNKLASILILVIAIYIIVSGNFLPTAKMRMAQSSYVGTSEVALPYGPGAPPQLGKNAIVQDSYAGASQVTTSQPQRTDERMVSRDASLSLVVKKVANVAAQIEQVTIANGGYVISSQITNPQDNSSGTIDVRVPAAKYKNVIAEFKSFALKVAAENQNAADITEAYQDTAEHLKPLHATKAKFEELLKNAKDVQDSLNVMRELQNLQYQIDSLQGQKKYAEDSANTSKITVYLSTDEYELPYAPLEPWSFKTVFKQTVRELVATLRSVAEWVIYILVNSVIWVPILVVAIVLRKKYLKQNNIADKK